MKVIGIDLGYLNTGIAVTSYPGLEVLAHTTIKANKKRVKKVTDEVRIARASHAYWQLKNVLLDYVKHHEPDAILYETPEHWIGGKYKGGKQSLNTLLALGAARERLYLALGQIDIQIPVHPISPATWQKMVTGRARAPKGMTMKKLVRKSVSFYWQDAVDDNTSQDIIDAIGIAIAGVMLLKRGEL